MTPEELRDIQNKVVLGQVKEATLRSELMEIEEEIQRRRWSTSPAVWIKDRLNETLWSKQVEIANSVVKHRKTTVPSCHASGKSFLAARLATWWIDTHPIGKAFVVTTATTMSQVKAVLWRELGRAHSIGGLPGRLNQTEWWVPNPDTGIEELVAFGRKPADTDQTAIQGIHAPYVLVIIDEAAGVPSVLFDGVESLMANEFSRILAIGNPEDGASDFAKSVLPGSGWNAIRIRAWDTPNFTEEVISDDLKKSLISNIFVEEKRKKWGINSPMWKAKIEAEFPETREDGLIPMSLINAARERTLEAGEPSELGVDVGGGTNKSVIAHRAGRRVRVLVRTSDPDTMATCGEVAHYLEITGAVIAKIDEVGIGRGVRDRAHEIGLAVVGINVGMQAKDDQHYANIRAEAYWGLREMFEAGDIDLDPEDDDLAAQLLELRFKRTSRGIITIETKEEMRRRKVPSPDDADAVMLACLDSNAAPRAPRMRKVSWG